MTTSNTPIIATTAVLASLNLPQWTARKYDESLSSELAYDKQAASDALRVNKLLVDKAVLKPMSTLMAKIRREYYRVSFPWSNEGTRLLPVAKYKDFVDFLDDQKQEFTSILDNLIADYITAVHQARDRMGDAFKLEDYPRPAEVRTKFSIDFQVWPVPTSGDFRVDVSAEQRRFLEEQVQANIAKQTAAATRHLWGQLGEMLESISTRLTDSDARFRRGLLDGFVELVDDLNKLNLANDPKLTEFYNDTRALVIVLRDPETVRKDKAVREDAAAATRELADKYSDFWG